MTGWLLICGILALFIALMWAQAENTEDDSPQVGGQ